MTRDDWRRYAAPAAFLLAATLAIVLIHSGLESGGHSAAPPTTPTAPAKHVTTTTPTTTSKQHAARRFWTVRAGDTFGVISAGTGVPVATIEKLNPTVKSTSLFIGEKIRVR